MAAKLKKIYWQHLLVRHKLEIVILFLLPKQKKESFKKRWSCFMEVPQLRLCPWRDGRSRGMSSLCSSPSVLWTLIGKLVEYRYCGMNRIFLFTKKIVKGERHEKLVEMQSMWLHPPGKYSSNQMPVLSKRMYFYWRHLLHSGLWWTRIRQYRPAIDK